MITLNMTGMTDEQKVEALTNELNKVLDDGTKQWIKYKTLHESFEVVQAECKRLQDKLNVEVSKVSRVLVVSTSKGRLLDKSFVHNNLAISMQDDGRTMKLFIKD